MTETPLTLWVWLTLVRLQGFPCDCLYTRATAQTAEFEDAVSIDRYPSQSHNGTALPAHGYKPPRDHCDICTALLRDAGPPRLCPGAEDTICPTAGDGPEVRVLSCGPTWRVGVESPMT